MRVPHSGCAGSRHRKPFTPRLIWLGTLTEAGYEDSLAGHTSLNTETVDYARRAIALLEAGQVTQADPFKSLEIARGFLNSALGWFLKDQSPVEAGAAF
jgi:hypothetical protein